MNDPLEQLGRRTAQAVFERRPRTAGAQGVAGVQRRMDRNRRVRTAGLLMAVAVVVPAVGLIAWPDAPDILFRGRDVADGRPTESRPTTPSGDPLPAVVHLRTGEFQTLAAAAMDDPSLVAHVVRDSEDVRAVWRMSDTRGKPPTLPAGTVGVVVFARQARSTCRSTDDVVGVKIVNDHAVVELDPNGEFMRPCPGPPGAAAWTTFVVALPARYDTPSFEVARNGARLAPEPSDVATASPSPAGRDCSAPTREPEPVKDWTQLAPPPVDGLEDGALAFVPSAGVFFATEAATRNVALLNTRTGRWTCVEPSPLSGKVPVAAASDTDTLLLWNGTYAASFDVNEGTWQRSAPPPGSGRALAAVVVENRLLVWWQTPRTENQTAGAAWDWRTNRWAPIAPAPIALTDATAVAGGSRSYLVGSWLGDRNNARTDEAVAAAYDAERDTWERLPPTGLSPQATSAAWVSGKLLAGDYELKAREYDDATKTWRHLPPAPIPFAECYPHNAALGRALFLSFCGEAAVYDTQTSRWSKVAVPGEIGHVVAADGIIVSVTLRGDAYEAKTWVFGP